MEIESKYNLVYALYKEFRGVLLDKTANISQFITSMKNIDPNKPESILSLLQYIQKTIQKVKYIISPNFTPENYKNDIKQINQHISNINGFIQKNQINPNNIPNIDILLKLMILMQTADKNNISSALQMIDIDNLKDSKFDSNTFISDYNKNINTIYDILNIIEKYDLFNILKINNNYDEFNILQDIYLNILSNTQLQNVVSYISFYNNMNPFISEDTSYDQVVKIASSTYNNPDFNQLDLKTNIIEINKLGLFDHEVKNIYQELLKQYKISDTKLFDDAKITGKDQLLYTYFNNLIQLEPIDVYADKTLNIQGLQTYITEQVFNIFKEINNYNLLVNACNINIDDKSIQTILLNLEKNKDIFIKSASLDNKTVKEFTDHVQKQFYELLGTDKIYTDKAKDKNIISNICNILLPDGKLNIKYLSTTFNNYIETVTHILQNLEKSDIYILYKAMQSMLVTEHIEYLMFGNHIISHKLFEDDSDNKSNMSDAFNQLLKKSEESETSLIDTAKQVLKDKGISTDSVNTNVSDTSLNNDINQEIEKVKAANKETVI